MFPALTLPENCSIMKTSFPIQHIYPAWKRILTIWQIMKGRELHKSQLHYCLVNWEKFGSTVLANIPKSIFAISSMNWGKWRSTARATFKNLNFWSIFVNYKKSNCWKKDKKFTQDWSHFKTDIVNEIFHFLKFQDFTNEFGSALFKKTNLKFWSK